MGKELAGSRAWHYHGSVKDTMAFDIQQVINSKLGISIISAIAGVMPVRLGYYLADLVAARIVASPRSRLVRAVRGNQWVINGERLDKVDLDKAVQAAFRNSAHSIFNLYHYKLDPGTMERLVVFDATMRQLAGRPEFDQRGLMLVALHISDWDLVLRALSLQGMRPLMLTIPNPQGSQRVEYELRRRTGMNLIPTSVGTLRHALKYLSQGGVVMTGIDRPIPDPKIRPRFFGRPADLPVHHVFLAAKARVPVMVIVTIRLPDGKNHIFTSDPVEMESHPDADTELLYNAEQVLRISEDFIRRASSQWSISLPVWPEALDQMPA
jgi:lauroyl/myristoyl acyltransferase